MGMFPTKTTRLPLPKGAKESFSVRYRGGRKQFDDEGEAMKFARAERSNENGWAEVTQVVERVISPR